jgi:Icc-related predicted phosphoesterase
MQDRALHAAHAGCKHLAKKMHELTQCRLHVFGHIHEDHGFLTDMTTEKTERVSVNAALAWGGQPIIVDLPNYL